MRWALGVVIASVVLGSSCGSGDDERADAESPATSAELSDGVAGEASATELCATVVVAEEGARVESPELTEISGLATSERHEGVVWAHNDSGSPAEIYAVGPDGEHLGRYAVSGADAVDWEDVSIGRGPRDDRGHLFIGDIGDNFGRSRGDDRPLVIYRVAEPDELVGEAEGATEAAHALEIAYEDGSRDAEALMFDPISGDVLVISKQWDATAAGVYRLPAEVALSDEAPAGPTTLERVADVAGTGDTDMVTGGDVSADGRMVALRTYRQVWLWDRDVDSTVGDTLSSPATCQFDVSEPQGEAVTFGAGGLGVVTVSEGDNPPILRHEPAPAG
jgi:hypothetical protein